MNLPNKLTVFRMILIPVFMLVLALPLDWGTLQVAGAVLPVTHLVAAIIFIVAMVFIVATQPNVVVTRHYPYPLANSTTLVSLNQMLR